MPISSTILEEVKAGKDWALLPLLPLNPANFIQDIIFSSFQKVLASQTPEENSIQSFPDLESNHLTFIASEKHDILWSKANRLLNKESSLALKFIVID